MRGSTRISTPTTYRVATTIAIVGAAALVYWTSTARPMWVDEQMLALNVRDRSFLGLAGPLWLDQSAPLGWLALERLMMVSLGTGERAVRLLTVLFGIGTLVTAIWIGRRWMSPLGAAILVALCAFGEWIVFFTLELKHYSADTFGALFLPALAAWAFEADVPTLGVGRAAPGNSRQFRRRVTVWWLSAAVCLWFANGALFVAPGCTAVLLSKCRRRDTPLFLATGLVWLASFALCYTLVLRHALENAYLKTYWAFAFPPVADGVRATLGWLVAQAGPFAAKPVGSGLRMLFWVAYASGMAVALVRRSALAAMFSMVPLSALALALLQIVPTFERLALWFVPSLYVGIALCGDAAVWLGRRGLNRRGFSPAQFGALVTSAAVLGVVVVAVCLDVIRRGVFALEHRPRSNYGLDDRSSVRWALEAHRPGDALLSTHYGLAAIWWYGGLNVADADRSGRLLDGTPIFEIRHVPLGEECSHWRIAMDSALQGRSRIVVYLGFRMNVEPPGFDTFVLEELGRRAVLVAYKEYAEESRVAVFDLGKPGSLPLQIPARLGAPTDQTLRAPAGCISITPARRW
jgi:hypothetical protein